MKYSRWYDKDNNLKIIVETLEKMSDGIKLSVANDIIQMVMERSDTDRVIEVLNSSYIADRRRWYDANETLHSAVELLKYIEETERTYILYEIAASIIHFQAAQNIELKKEEI